MLKLTDLARLGRAVRQDDWADLGVPTPERICEAIDQGHKDAELLARAGGELTLARGREGGRLEQTHAALGGEGVETIEAGLADTPRRGAHRAQEVELGAGVVDEA